MMQVLIQALIHFAVQEKLIQHWDLIFFLIHMSDTSIDTSVDSLCCIGEINTTLGSFLKVGEET